MGKTDNRWSQKNTSQTQHGHHADLVGDVGEPGRAPIPPCEHKSLARARLGMFVRSLIPWAGLRFFHLLRIEFRPQEIAMIGGEKKSRHSAVVTELDQVHALEVG